MEMQIALFKEQKVKIAFIKDFLGQSITVAN